MAGGGGGHQHRPTGTLPYDLPQKHLNNRTRNWGRRLIGHPPIYLLDYSIHKARSPVLALFGEITYSGFLEERVQPQKQSKKGKTKTTKEKHRTPLPPRIQKGPQKGQASSIGKTKSTVKVRSWSTVKPALQEVR